MTQRKLHLGCGTDIREGWVNLDSADLPGVDIVCDIEDLPLPFEDEEFDEIRCDNILEHVDYIPVLKEIHRILKTGGQLRIRVPHFTSRNSYRDPTHKNCFSVETFIFFVSGQTKCDYYFDFHFSKVKSQKVKFLKRGIFWGNRLIEPLVNCSPKMHYFYESSFMCRLFPANDVVVELIK
jgi:ubiquinone/menaquinone biosynthesis C-methylase UbiE